ncbi:efflux RND transporter periplasmic adaptor subunit [Paracoccus jeotgali]|uniref:efflux RND transporter periplasmic adaptor subunit n=1 Tax=Paracoccus jeotgali TaxID=2065379 RepID=UPI0028AAEE79|nr:efflux RND transporter periplasmic adaptor subunit [Paracoccus jeotgali]
MTNALQAGLRASIVILAGWAGLAGAAQAQAPGGAPPPPQVTVVTLQTDDITLTSSLPGRVTASAEAELRPQVNGIIIERLFDEGRVVEQGDPLYRIDPRTYEAAVAQAEASLAQAQAQSDAAERDAKRIGTLRDRSVATQQAEDSAISARDAAAAAVKAAQAALDVAKLDLERTTVSAPLDGVIGLAQASQGQLVTAGQQMPMAVIRRIDPVLVDVTQSAADIVRWQRQGAAASLPKGAGHHVSLRLADGSIYEHTGSLTGAEPHVDETTGVVTLRMEFANPDGLLLPGMYVLADIPQALLTDVVLAPQEGVTRDRRGRPIAYVVNAENVVEERPLEIVQDHGNQWVVREGLSAGDRLVVAGLQRIGPGVTVTPEELAAPDAAPPAAAAPPIEAPAEADAATAPDAATGDAAAAATEASETAADGAAPAMDGATEAATDSVTDTPAETPADTPTTEP